MAFTSKHLKLSRLQLLQLVGRLERRVKTLEAQVEILAKEKPATDRHQANITGQSAEIFVAKLLNAEATLRNADHDMIVKNGLRLEVKGSACNTFRSGKYWYRRWTWHNFMGIGKQQKFFHRLILVGEAPDDLREEYLDPLSPYVIFDLPFSFAQRIAADRSDERGHFAFGVIASPDSAKSSASNRELWRHQVTQEQLISEYRT